jgi:hypothetical protein
MKEPRFADAPCFGKEFNPKSKVCGVCLASAACQQKSQKSATARGFSAVPLRLQEALKAHLLT